MAIHWACCGWWTVCGPATSNAQRSSRVIGVVRTSVRTLHANDGHLDGFHCRWREKFVSLSEAKNPGTGSLLKVSGISLRSGRYWMMYRRLYQWEEFSR